MLLSDITDLITSFGAFLSPVAAIVGVIYAKQAKGHAKEASKQATQANEGEPLEDRGNGTSPRIYEMMLDNSHRVRALAEELANHVESEDVALGKVQESIDQHVEWEVNRYLSHQHAAETLHAPLEGEKNLEKDEP